MNNPINVYFNKNKDEYQNILDQLNKYPKIISSKLEANEFFYLIFNPINSINLQQLIEIYLNDKQISQQDNDGILIFNIIISIIEELKKFKLNNLPTQKLHLRNVLIFRQNMTPLLQMKFSKFQIKFFDFDTGKFFDEIDKSSIDRIIEILTNYIDKEKNQTNKIEQDNEKNISEKKKNKKQLYQQFQPFKVEYIYKMNEQFNQKLENINKTDFIEVFIWQRFYYHLLTQKSQEHDLNSILKKIDCFITIYKEFQSKLSYQQNQEIRLLKQFYESQFRQNNEVGLEIASVVETYKSQSKFYFLSDIITVVKQELVFFDKQQFKNRIDEIFTNVWKYFQENIQKQFFDLASKQIIKNIEMLIIN